MSINLVQVNDNMFELNYKGRKMNNFRNQFMLGIYINGNYKLSEVNFEELIIKDCKVFSYYQ